MAATPSSFYRRAGFSPGGLPRSPDRGGPGGGGGGGFGLPDFGFLPASPAPGGGFFPLPANLMSPPPPGAPGGFEGFPAGPLLDPYYAAAVGMSPIGSPFPPFNPYSPGNMAAAAAAQQAAAAAFSMAGGGQGGMMMGGGTSGGSQGGVGGVGSEEIRTIFLTGFPEDVKDREIHNLLRFLPGYEASQMHWRAGQQPQGFALFSTPIAARAAVEILSRMPFDDEAALRCEVARKNMYLKPGDPTIKRANGASATAAVAAAAAMLSMAPTTAAMAAFGGGALPMASITAAYPGGPARPALGFAPVSNVHDNPPCNTLFIGNLGDGISEAELRSLFTSQPGFKQLKMVRGAKQVSAFIEFHDVSSAIAVHESLQGSVLATSDRGGIRIQYSKNPFGKRSPTGEPSEAGGYESSVEGGGGGGGPGSATTGATAERGLSSGDIAAAPAGPGSVTNSASGGGGVGNGRPLDVAAAPAGTVEMVSLLGRSASVASGMSGGGGGGGGTGTPTYGERSASPSIHAASV